MRPNLLSFVAFAQCAATADAAFGLARSSSSRKGTALFLEDHIADMIDKELYRQQHHDEFDKEWHEKTHALVEQTLKSEINLESEAFLDDTPRQKAKDKKMAQKDPQRYCADRCVSTGNCDVYEDIYEMSPQQVMAFCEECVLSEEEEPCDVPEAMFNGLGDENAINGMNGQSFGANGDIESQNGGLGP